MNIEVIFLLLGFFAGIPGLHVFGNTEATVTLFPP